MKNHFHINKNVKMSEFPTHTPHYSLHFLRAAKRSNTSSIIHCNLWIDFQHLMWHISEKQQAVALTFFQIRVKMDCNEDYFNSSIFRCKMADAARKYALLLQRSIQNEFSCTCLYLFTFDVCVYQGIKFLLKTIRHYQIKPTLNCTAPIKRRSHCKHSLTLPIFVWQL